MIVFSSALILTLAAADELWKPIIGWHNLVTVSNVVADEEDADFPATNLANPQTFSLWKSGSTAAHVLTITLSGEHEVDYVGIARHNLGSGLCTVSVWAITGDIGAVYEEVLAEQYLGGDGPAMLVFEGDHYVGVEVRLTPDAVEPQAAVLYVGHTLTLQRGIQPGHVPIPYGRTLEVLNGRSMSGEFLGSVITSQSLASQANVGLLDPDWYRANFQPFLDAHVPFFFAWSPETYPDEVGYAWLTADPQPRVSTTTGEVDVSIQFAAVAL
jgi:hypothetical protein